jgi:hypothetical protein
VKYFGRDNSHCVLRKQIVLAREQGVFHISKDISATGGGQVFWVNAKNITMFK